MVIWIIFVGIGLVLSAHWVADFTKSIFTKSITLDYISLKKGTTLNFYANLTSKDFHSISVYLFTKPMNDTQNKLKVFPAVSETITNQLGKKILQTNFIKQSTYFFEPKPSGVYTL